MPLVRSATAAELPAVGRVLAAAFDDDPVWQHLRSPRADWSARAASWFEADARAVLAGPGEVLVDDEVGGVALWAAPGHWRSSPRETLGLLVPSLRLFGTGTARSARTLATLERLHPRDPEHWYLAMLGTDPDRQGRGIGSALIAAVTDRCDEQGLGAYLESSKESNVPFYVRHGFAVVEEVVLPADGPTMWRMWRDPGGPERP